MKLVMKRGLLLVAAGMLAAGAAVAQGERGLDQARLARLDAKRYLALKVDPTSDDGYTEVSWDMEGPPGDYELIVDVKIEENGPATTAKGSFRWK